MWSYHVPNVLQVTHRDIKPENLLVHILTADEKPTPSPHKHTNTHGAHGTHTHTSGGGGSASGAGEGGGGGGGVVLRLAGVLRM